MGESLEHQGYVKRIVEYAKALIPEDAIGKLAADLDGFETPSLTYNTYVPDVLYRYNDLLIIGEAKTYEDFSREHSKRQYDAYIEECCKFSGESVLIVAIPWELFISAKNTFRKKKRNCEKNIRVVIISSNGKKEEV